MSASCAVLASETVSPSAADDARRGPREGSTGATAGGEGVAGPRPSETSRGPEVVVHRLDSEIYEAGRSLI